MSVPIAPLHRDCLLFGLSLSRLGHSGRPQWTACWSATPGRVVVEFLHAQDTSPEAFPVFWSFQMKLALSSDSLDQATAEAVSSGDLPSSR